MKSHNNIPMLALCCLLCLSWLNAASGVDFIRTEVVVDRSGHGDFTRIGDALHALAMFSYQRTVILIKNGLYEEKVRIDRNYVTLRGENRDRTIIRYSQPWEAWNENPDAVGPAVVNLYGDDTVIENLTIENSQPENNRHAFAVLGDGTRIVIRNCKLIGRGGDTVSLWNYKEGMYYLTDCLFQGAVDFVCPRGWCYIRDSQFHEVKKTAALWHDGHFNPEQKFVLRGCDFTGIDGFQLGRHHYDAAFYFIDCRFPANMADKFIYRVLQDDTTKDDPDDFGERCYFHHCRKEGQAFDWMKDNLDQAQGRPEPEAISPSWTFGKRWDPESDEAVRVDACRVEGRSLALVFNEIITVRGTPKFQNKFGKTFTIRMRRFTDTNRLTFWTDEPIMDKDLKGDLRLFGGAILASIAGQHERFLGPVFQIR
jgi:pectinesterase